MKSKSRTILSTLAMLIVLVMSAAVSTASAPRAAPANDDFADATLIPLNYTMRIDSVEAATSELGEPATCPMENSIWFTFTAPFTGSVALTTATSMMMRGTGNFDTDTLIEVYTGADLISLVPLTCADDESGEVAEIDNLQIVQGTVYSVRVGARPADVISGPLLAPSQISLTVRIRNATDWGVNSAQMDFEGPLTAWSIRSGTNGDAQVCGTAEQFDGSCAVKLVGGQNENTRLVQTFDWPYATVRGNKHHFLEFSVNLNIASENPRVKIVLILSYFGNKPATRSSVTVKSDSGGVYKDYEVFAYFASPKVKSVKLLVVNRSTSGTVLVDGAYVDYDGGLLRNASVLPVPLAAK